MRATKTERHEEEEEEEKRKADMMPPMSSFETSLSSLREILDSMADPQLRSLVASFLDDERFARRLRTAQAAVHNHHAYPGGLLEHILSLARLADAVAKHYPQVDRDLLLAGVFLHDIGKVDEIDVSTSAPARSDAGEFLGHLCLGLLLVERRIAAIEGFCPLRRLQVLHLIASHHGREDWGSPVRPKTIEAIVLHRLDDIDAKVGGFSRAVAGDQGKGRWTEWDRMLGTRLFKGEPGRSVALPR